MAVSGEECDALGALAVIDRQQGCCIYQEANGQLLVVVDRRPEEFWVADSLPSAQGLCRRLQSLESW
jgi:hypothetical protein